MPAFSSTAPGKIILLGEHAVVYGLPALAVPVTQVQARSIVQADPLAPSGRIYLSAPDIGLEAALDSLPVDHPLSVVLRLASEELGGRLPACKIKITSTILPASGLGSGAAVSVAVLRAVSAFAGKPFSDETVNRLAFEVEKVYHGTPSGIDNTVITYNQPVYFVRGHAPVPLQPGAEFTFVVGDTGIASPTSQAVARVRANRDQDPARFDSLFAETGRLVDSARKAIETGEHARLGIAMNRNHVLLQQFGVSTPELNRLVDAALQAGALGAKLSGAGMGGNMIALVTRGSEVDITAALLAAGAVRTLVTSIHPVY
jgi:mevalonate kinase